MGNPMTRAKPSGQPGSVTFPDEVSLSRAERFGAPTVRAPTARAPHRLPPDPLRANQKSASQNFSKYYLR